MACMVPCPVCGPAGLADCGSRHRRRIRQISRRREPGLRRGRVRAAVDPQAPMSPIWPDMSARMPDRHQPARASIQPNRGRARTAKPQGDDRGDDRGGQGRTAGHRRHSKPQAGWDVSPGEGQSPTSWSGSSLPGSHISETIAKSVACAMAESVPTSSWPGLSGPSGQAFVPRQMARTSPAMTM